MILNQPQLGLHDASNGTEIRGSAVILAQPQLGLQDASDADTSGTALKAWF